VYCAAILQQTAGVCCLGARPLRAAIWGRSLRGRCSCTYLIERCYGDVAGGGMPEQQAMDALRSLIAAHPTPVSTPLP